MFCACVYVSRTVFFFRCPVKIHPLPLTVDMRPLSQPSFHFVSFKIAIGNATSYILQLLLLLQSLPVQFRFRLLSRVHLHLLLLLPWPDGGISELRTLLPI